MHASIRERRSEGGFTLIELLVVMIIIAILMAVAVPTFLAQKNNAQKTKATANIKQIVNAIESCAANNTDGSYNLCTTDAQIKGFEKGLNSLPAFITAPPSATQYGIFQVSPSSGTTSPQGYLVQTVIKDGNVNVWFAEVHYEDGRLLKYCGGSAFTGAMTGTGAMPAPTPVPGSRTCTNGRWG